MLNPLAQHMALSRSNITEGLSTLTRWTYNEDRLAIERDYVFETFADAFAFMTRIAFVAESMDHHPEWSNVYNRVHISLTTHDDGGVTAKDFALAQAMENAASHFRPVAPKGPVA